MQTKTDFLDKYKRQPFANGLIPFTGAVRVIGEPFARIFAKEAGCQCWVICDTKTKDAAVFSHAAMITSTHDIETGNYVPDGEDTPSCIEGKMVQRRVNAKCNYTYTFDTYMDISLYEGQWVLDDHMRTVTGFNPGGLPRRAYLSGQEVKFRSKFWMQTAMFLQRGSNETHVPPPAYLHPWVTRGDEDSKIFRANPDQPRVWVKEEDGIVPISEREPKHLQRGDVVAMSFTVTYHVTSVHWFAQFHPVDIVVLKPSDFDATDYSAPVMNLYNQPPPSFDVRLVDGGSHDWEYINDKAHVAELHPPSNAMESIDTNTAPVIGGMQDTIGPVEAMEVDYGSHAGEGEEVNMTSMTPADIVDDDGFMMVVQEDQQSQMEDEFVDVQVAEGKRTTHAGSSRGARGRRKRGHSASA